MERKKRETLDQKNQRVIKTIIDEMFRLAGHQVTYEDILPRKDNWYQQYTMTEAQNQEWRKFMDDFLKREYRTTMRNEKYRSRQIAWLDLMYGLKIENK